MKLVCVFLACIFAAQAAVPSYEYWCAHNLQVFPPQSYYCYRVAFKNVWCSSKYYADCLVQFPVSKEGSCDAEIENLVKLEKTSEQKCLITKMHSLSMSKTLKLNTLLPLKLTSKTATMKKVMNTRTQLLNTEKSCLFQDKKLKKTSKLLSTTL